DNIDPVKGFCDTLPPRGFKMRHFALAEKVFACVTTKARVLTDTMEPLDPVPPSIYSVACAP
ncbi:MAG TPA: hypothetical protein VMT20_11070, partial [Terriglobia bacterium]|nr:hypothetical protein [Terriglobia bacterium]